MQKHAGFLFYQANLSYSYFKTKYDVKSYDNRNFSPVMSESFHHIDFNVVGGLLINNFRIGVGPVVHVLGGYNSELEVIPEYNNRIKSHTFGFTSSVGYNFKGLFIDLIYENSFRSKNFAITAVLAGKEANCEYIMFCVQFLLLA